MRAGNPNDFAGLGEILIGALIVICVGSILLIGVPLLRLTAGHAGARIALIIGEAVTALPLAAAISILVNDSGAIFVAGPALPLLELLPLVVIVLMGTREARSWTQLPLNAAYAAYAARDQARA